MTKNGDEKSCIAFVFYSFKFGLRDCVHYNKEFDISRLVISEFLFHTFYRNFVRAEENRLLLISQFQLHPRPPPLPSPPGNCGCELY